MPNLPGHLYNGDAGHYLTIDLFNYDLTLIYGNMVLL